MLRLRKKTVEKKFPAAKEAWRKPPPSVVSIMEQVLDKNREEWPNFFRPSMLAGCARMNVYHYIHAPQGPEQHDNRLQRILLLLLVEALVVFWLLEQ